MHILQLAQQHHGLVIVDSTRKGKRYPDSFLKTIPIWCHVLNTAIYQVCNKKHWQVPELHLHESVELERPLIEVLLPQFVPTHMYMYIYMIGECIFKLWCQCCTNWTSIGQAIAMHLD